MTDAIGLMWKALVFELTFECLVLNLFSVLAAFDY